jgi:hypothetical protein
MSDIDDAVALAKAAQPFLTSKPSEIQGAALAGLLAIWLAGHVVHDDPAATKLWRAKILKIHLTTVRRLTSIYSQTLAKSPLRIDA